MVVCQSSLLPSSSSSVRACSEVGRSRNVSDLNLGPHLGFFVNNNGCHVTFFNIKIAIHPPFFHRHVCIDFATNTRTNILNSIIIVKSIFSALLQHHLFMNLKYPWSSMLLGLHSRKHLQKYVVTLT